MSSIAAFYVRDKDRDTVYIATDTLACIKKEVVVNGVKYPEGLHSFGSKILYWPHLKSSVASLGTLYLSRKIDLYISTLRGIKSFDELVYAIETAFVERMLKDVSSLEVVLDEKSPDFLGLLFVTGLSYESIDIKSKIVHNRKRPILLSVKLMVYKDKVVNGGFINTEQDQYNSEFIYAVHPPIDPVEQESIFMAFEPLLVKNSQSAYPTMLTQMLKEAHRQYVKSGRKTLVSGGDVIITIMDNSANMPLVCSQFASHRFEDFDANLKEIIELGETV